MFGALHRFHSLYRGNLFLECRLDATLQGHRSHRAPTACAGEAHLHHAPLDVDEFHVSPVRLEGRANLVQYLLHFHSHRGTSLPHLLFHYTMRRRGTPFLDEDQSADSISNPAFLIAAFRSL